MATSNEKRHRKRRADSNDAPAATVGTIRTNNSPSRDKRANDSGAQRLTHMRWERTAKPGSTRFSETGTEFDENGQMPGMARRGSMWLEPGPGTAPLGCSKCSNYVSDLESRYGIEP